MPLAIDEGLGDDAILLQTFMGVSTSIGAFLFGVVILSKSQQCMISRQYLLQTSIFGIGKLLFTVAGNVGFLSWVVEKTRKMLLLTKNDGLIFSNFSCMFLVFLLISNLINRLRLHQFLGTKTTEVNMYLKTDANRAY